MVIGIEAERANSRHKTGVERYAQQLILHLAKIDTTNQYILYLRTEPEKWFLGLPKNFSVKVMPFPLFWTQLRLSWELYKHPIDVLFVPASACPIIHPKKTVVTIHDLAWKFYPGTFTWFNRNFLEWSTRFAVQGAHKIIAVSEATKKDLLKFYGINSEKITVIHHGFNLEEDGGGESTSLPLPEKYILFLSTLQPRKNLQGLITAFVKLKKELPELPHKLLVVGRPGWKFRAILEAIEENKENILLFTKASEREKTYILFHADLLVLPSFYEGFGMTILEAFAAGIPVATGNVSSMPEIASDAAIYFDPANTGDIKNALKSVLLDRSLHDRLVAKGTERLKSFSWERSAQATLTALTS